MGEYVVFLFAAAAIFVFVMIVSFFKRYKRCPSDRILVVYGKVGKGVGTESRSAKCIHGGAAFIWPVIQDYQFMDLTPISIEVNLTNALRNYNRMSFSFAHVFNRDFLGNHIYRLDSILFLDDVPIYKIDFSSSYSRVNSSYYAKGNIFISKQDFGIYNLDYSLFDGSHKLLYRVNISYKPIGDRYFLNYITFNNYFEVNGGAYFKVNEVVYDYNSSSFQVLFNEAVDPNSMRAWQKQFRFLTNNTPLQILDLSLIKPDVIQVSIHSSRQINEAIMKDGIRYEINRLKDTCGRLLNEQKSIRANQFREIFVQKVFPESYIDSVYEFVNKRLPLKASKQNSLKQKETYWINTPLKATK